MPRGPGRPPLFRPFPPGFGVTEVSWDITSDTPVLMLDEPTTNLDAQGVAWYLSQVEEFSRDRLLILCSNQPQEYAFCKNLIDLSI